MTIPCLRSSATPSSPFRKSYCCAACPGLFLRSKNKLPGNAFKGHVLLLQWQQQALKGKPGHPKKARFPCRSASLLLQGKRAFLCFFCNGNNKPLGAFFAANAFLVLLLQWQQQACFFHSFDLVALTAKGTSAFARDTRLLCMRLLKAFDLVALTACNACCCFYCVKTTTSTRLASC